MGVGARQSHVQGACIVIDTSIPNGDAVKKDNLLLINFLGKRKLDSTLIIITKGWLHAVDSGKHQQKSWTAELAI